MPRKRKRPALAQGAQSASQIDHTAQTVATATSISAPLTVEAQRALARLCPVCGGPAHLVMAGSEGPSGFIGRESYFCESTGTVARALSDQELSDLCDEIEDNPPPLYDYRQKSHVR